MGNLREITTPLVNRQFRIAEGALHKEKETKGEMG